jgi:uncharacterized RDD family membrane protein YckC
MKHSHGHHGSHGSHGGQHGGHHGGHHGAQHAVHHADLTLAEFSERAVAFAVDAGVFWVLAYATLALFFPSYSVWANPHEQRWFLLWIALFIFYQAFFSADGRVSLGKHLVGLRVVDVEGEPLGLGQSLVRSVLYLPSSFFDAGFLWSLFNPAHQCWHDMAVGSVVISKGKRRAGGRALMRGLAALVIAGYAFSSYWHYSAGPRYHRLMDVSYAKVGANEISLLQQIFHLEHGRYAESLEELAPASNQPKQFLADMNALFDRKQPLKLTVTKKGYQFQAHANDEYRTLIAFAGP